MQKFTRIITIALMTGMLVASMSASAAGHKCKHGLKWDETKKICVKK